MKMFLSGLMATALAASFAIATGAPANASPVYVPQSEQARTDIQKAEYDGYWRPYHRYGRDRGERRHAWRAYRAERWAMRHAYRPYYDDDYYYRPYYRHSYPGYYRYHRRPGVSLFFSF
jgi:hypothetical protein